MLSLFNEDFFHRARIYNIPNEAMLKKRYLEDYSKLHSYLLSRKFTLPNDHILVKLIKSVNVSFKRDLYDYVETVYDVTPDLEAMLKLTSPLNFYLPNYKSNFYNNKCTEVLISVREDFDINKAMKYWKNLEPLRVISHPFTDLSYTPLVGKYVSSNASGMVYIFIDIPKLMFQYRMWIRDQLVNGKKPDDITKFLIDYPLFNLMKSHTDVALFNRIHNVLRNVPSDPYNSKISLATIDNTKYADATATVFVSQIIKSPVRFDEIIQNMPTVFNKDYLNVIRLPDIAKTRQVKTVLVGARLKLFEFLLEVNTRQNSSINRSWLNIINNELRYLTTENILKYGLQSETDEQVRNIRRLLVDAGF